MDGTIPLSAGGSGGWPPGLAEPWAGRDRALEVLEAALAGAAADHIEIFLASRIGHHTRFAATRIHQPQTIVECQVMVRAVAGTGSARVAVSDLSQAAAAVKQAADLARHRDGRPGAAAPYGVAGPAPVPQIAGLWQDATAAWDEGARSAQAGRIMDAARAAGGTAAGVLTAAVTELAVATSAGQRAHAAATEAGFALTARVGEASSYAADLGRDAARLDVDERAERAVGQAARAAAAPLVPVPDGRHDVVFGGLATGELIGFLPDFGFTAPAVAAGIGLAATRPGADLAPAAITVADDALGGAGLGEAGLPFPFDFEGTPKRRVELIAAGRVGGAVSDLASAGATGGVSTGHAHIARESSPAPEAASLIMSPGSASEDDLIAGVERGLYIQRLWYNRLVDAEAGTVVGTSRDGCFLISGGKLTAGLAGGRFNESVLGALARTDGIGRGLVSQPVPNVWNGCATAPAIRVRGFRFGARTATDTGKETS
jgi:PmbA protein